MLPAPVSGDVSGVLPGPMSVPGIGALSEMWNPGPDLEHGVARLDNPPADLVSSYVPAPHHATHDAGGSDPMVIDAAAATGSLRTLGAGGAQACAGNDARLSNSRVPLAHEATHKFGGTDAFLSSDLLDAIVKRLQESSGPTNLLIGAVANGQYLQRVGATVVGSTPAGIGTDWPIQFMLMGG